MSSGINQPNRIDSWILDDGEKLWVELRWQWSCADLLFSLTITEDPKIPNAATILLKKQDHTMANMIRSYVQISCTITVLTSLSQLLLDPSILFAGYKVPHPLETDVILKIQTDERSNPADALKRACTLLIQQTLEVKRQFSEQARNVEMGLGLGAEAQPAAVGGYDPYGDGLGASGAARPADTADAYDF